MSNIIVYKSGSYRSLPMTDVLYWNRVELLKKAMLTAENFEFRLMYYKKLQDLLQFVP